MNLNLVLRFLLFHIFVFYTCFRLSVFFMRLKIARVVCVFSFYSEDCFSVPRFISVNVLKKKNCRSHTHTHTHTHTNTHTHTYIHTHIQIYIYGHIWSVCWFNDFLVILQWCFFNLNNFYISIIFYTFLNIHIIAYFHPVEVDTVQRDVW